MNNLQKFDQFVMSYATPIFDDAKQKVDIIRNRYNQFVQNITKDIIFQHEKLLGIDGSLCVSAAIMVAPVSLVIFTAMSCLSTPSLVLVGTLGAVAAVALPDGLTKDGKLRLVASALSVDAAFTAIKVLTALAALDAGAALLALTVGGGIGVGLYAGYRWLSQQPQVNTINDCINTIENPQTREVVRNAIESALKLSKTKE